MNKRAGTMTAVLACCIAVTASPGQSAAQNSTRQGYDETSVLGDLGAPGTPALTPASDTPSDVGVAGEKDQLTPGGGSSTRRAVGGAHTVDLQGSGRGRLPFTGTDLALLAVLAGALLAVGVALRRSTRQE